MRIWINLRTFPLRTHGNLLKSILNTSKIGVMNAKQWFGLAGRGTTLGLGILPGVSVGTVGIIVDVYDKLLSYIDGLRSKKTFLASVAGLIPIGLGCLAATFLLLLFWNKVAYPYFPFVMVCALAGFIVGALPLMTGEIKGHKLNVPDYLRMLIGFLIAGGIGVVAFLGKAGVIPLDLDFWDEIDAPFQNAWILIVVFVVGLFSAVSCLVPGISGSMIMFIFGLYNPIIGLFMNTELPSGAMHPSIFHDTSKLGGGVVIILVLLLGMLIGFLATAKFMKSMLANHRHGTFTVIIGFVLGSLVAMFFNNDMYDVYVTPPLNAWYQFVIGGILLIGIAALTFILLKRASAKKAKLESSEAK